MPFPVADSSGDPVYAPNPLKGNAEYQFKCFVGRGSFGCVVHAVDRQTDESVAIKFLPRGRDLDVERVKREVLNHRSLYHFHVIRFHKLILTPLYLGIVMEFAEGGNLKDYVHCHGRLEDDVVRFLFQQLVLGVEYCHRVEVVNRDIKLQNTLVTSSNSQWPMIKICDFGYSKHHIADSRPDSIVGTRQTMPPEVVLLNDGQTYDGVQADIWCIGVFLYTLAANRYPFYASDEKITDAELFRRTVHLEYTIPPWVPNDCADLIQRILVREPEQRPSIEDIKNHPYFTHHLPRGAEHMNQRLVRQRSQQTVDEIERILFKAKASRVTL